MNAAEIKRENQRLCEYTIKTETDLYVENKAGCWGNAQDEALQIATEHDIVVTLIAREAGTKLVQEYTVYPLGWPNPATKATA